MRLTKVERLLIRRYFWNSERDGFTRLTSWFALVGIALGVATLIVVLAVMNGFRHDLIANIIGTQSHLTIQSPLGRPLERYQDMRQLVAEQPEVSEVSALVAGEALLTTQGKTTGARVLGMWAADLQRKTKISVSLPKETLQLFDSPDQEGVLLGQYLARRLGTQVGQMVTLIVPDTMAGAFGGVPRRKALRVLGIFHSGLYEYDAYTAIIPFPLAQKLFLKGAGASFLEVFVKNPTAIDPLEQRLSRSLNQHFDPVQLSDWREDKAPLLNAVEIERNVMFVILTLIIAVAAFNIITTLVTLVKDKKRDIAILKTIGMPSKSLMRVFLVLGMGYGVLGCLLGTTLGLAVSLNVHSIQVWLEKLSGTVLFSPEIYFLSRLPAHVEWGETMLVIIVALALSLLASLYPAWRAARLNPVEGVRYE